MEPITIMIAAMIANAAMQYKASTDAAKRATKQTQLALARQDEYQRKAENVAKDAALKFDAGDRKEKQAVIEEELTQQYTKPMEAAQTINQEAATTQGNVSKDYLAAKATSDARTMESSRALAKLLAKTGAAGNMRMNESFDVGDAATKIGMLGNFSQGQNAADQIAIRSAGTPDAGLILGGQLIGAAGTAYGMGSAASKAASQQAYAQTLAQNGAAGTTTGIGATGAAYNMPNTGVNAFFASIPK